jgi:hypothetical protein
MGYSNKYVLFDLSQINMVICWRANLKLLSVCSGTAKGAFGNSPEGVGFSPELLVHPSNPIGWSLRSRGARVVECNGNILLV